MVLAIELSYNRVGVSFVIAELLFGFAGFVAVFEEIFPFF